MSRLRAFPIAGGAYKDDTLPWSAQDTVNWLPVNAEAEGTTSPVLLRGLPGMTGVVTGAQAAGLPVRGGYDADGFCVVVIGQTLYQFDGTTATSIGSIPGIQRVGFAHNQVAGGVQIVIANGTGGYVYDTSTGAFGPITDDAFPGAKAFAYNDSYIIGVEPGGNYWFTSDLADATSYNALNRYEAESEPDRIMTLLVSHEDVVIFGARTTEFWYDSGENTNTFQRRGGTGFEIGCVSPWAAVNLDNTVYWRGHDGSAYRLNGYTAQRISTAPIEQAWARTDPSQCFAMTFIDRGHKIVYFCQPDGQTWGYDAATGEWHRRQSYLMNRWRANCLFSYQGKWYAGDYTNGSISRLDWKVGNENGKPMIAERTTTVMQDDRNRFRLNAAEVVMDVEGKTEIAQQQQSGFPPAGFGPDLLFDAPDAWQDSHNIGVFPPVEWDGAAYNLDTSSGTDVIQTDPLTTDGQYASYIAPGTTLYGHVAWTSQAPDNSEFKIFIPATAFNSDIILADQILTGSSGEFNFSYTFDGSEGFGSFSNPTGAVIQVAIIGEPNGEGGYYDATAVITRNPPPAPPAEAPPGRHLELAISKDGGHTFSPWRQADLGKQGNFNARALFRRLGIMRRGVLRIRYSGDSTRDVVQASVDTSAFP